MNLCLMTITSPLIYANQYTAVTRGSRMSFLRSKFRLNERSDEFGSITGTSKEKPASSDDGDTYSNASKKSARAGKGPPTDGKEDVSTEDWHQFEDKEVFEMQLSNLQEQLVATMINNKKLTKELEELKKEQYVGQLYKQLEEEKEKNNELKARVMQLEEETANERMTISETDGYIEGNLGNVNYETTAESSSSSSTSQSGRLHMWFQNKMMTILQDLSDDTDLEDTPAPVEEELSVRKLKENMRRFKSGYEPVLLYFKVLSALLSWRSPASTFLAFLLYMYAIYSGWYLTVFFGLILWHFSKTYLISRGWNIQFSLLPYHAVEESSEEDKTLGMSDKFQLVLQVAKKAQNLLGEAADGLEKLHNLIMWSDVEVTSSLYRNVLAGFSLSLFLPASTLLTYTGFFIGFKLFITSNLYRRYPRIKQKYDTTRNMWRKLPTHEEKAQRQIVAQRKQYLVNVAGARPSSSSTSQTLDSVTQGDGSKDFNVFKLRNNECPLQGWEDGKRATLIQKEKAIAAAFRSGKMYLTKSYLCFCRSRVFSPKNITIPLCDITKLEKIKPFNFLPGSGMSIEIHVSSAEKPYVFGAILKRDEVFEEILQVAQEAQLAWSKDAGSEGEHVPSDQDADVSD